jgi:hypothetical protein
MARSRPVVGLWAVRVGRGERDPQVLVVFEGPREVGRATKGRLVLGCNGTASRERINPSPACEG